MIGTAERPYAGRLERWKDQINGSGWKITGYLFDVPKRGEPDKFHITSDVEVLNRVTGELKTKTNYYKLGKEG